MDRFRLGEQRTGFVAPAQVNHADPQGDLRVGQVGAAAGVVCLRTKMYRALKQWHSFGCTLGEQKPLALRQRRLRLPTLEVGTQATLSNAISYAPCLLDGCIRPIARQVGVRADERDVEPRVREIAGSVRLHG